MMARRRNGERMRRRRLLGVALAGGAGAAFLAACGGGESKEGEGVQEAVIPASTRAAEQGAPKPGGTLTIRQSANAPLDPHANATFTAQTLASYTLARLLRFKTGLDPAVGANYELEGDLAESVEMPGDGLTATFKLRPNATWQSVAPVDGRRVEAEDVRFSVERFRTEPRNNNRGVLGTAQSPLVEAVETPDERTIVFKLAKPYGPFRNLMANSNYLWIVPKEIGAGRFDPAKQAIGAGPFILESTQPDIAYKVRKHPAYYAAPRPYVDGITLAIIAEEAQEVAQFQAGRLDTATLPAERVDEVRRSLPKATIVEYMPQTHQYLAFQQRGASMLRDERIRRAAQMSIDRDALLSLIYQNRGSWNSALPANFGKWRVDPKSAEIGPGGQWYKYNPAEAKKLLAAAGHPNGLPVRFLYTNNIYGERFNQSAEAIAGMLKEGGFNVQVIIQDYSREWITPGTGTVFGNFEGIACGLAANYSDPHDYFFNGYHSKSTRGTAGVNDPQLDALIEKEESTLDENERVKLVKEIQRYLADKVYYSNTAVGPAFTGVQEWVKNFQRNYGFGTGAETYANVWIDRGS